MDFFFGIFGFFSKLLRLLLKVTKVTTDWALAISINYSWSIFGRSLENISIFRWGFGFGSRVLQIVKFSFLTSPAFFFIIKSSDILVFFLWYLLVQSLKYRMVPTN